MPPGYHSEIVLPEPIIGQNCFRRYVCLVKMDGTLHIDGGFGLGFISHEIGQTTDSPFATLQCRRVCCR